MPGVRLSWSEYADPEARDKRNERITPGAVTLARATAGESREGTTPRMGRARILFCSASSTSLGRNLRMLGRARAVELALARKAGDHSREARDGAFLPPQQRAAVLSVPREIASGVSFDD